MTKYSNCKSILKTAVDSTSGLHKHLKGHHKVTILKSIGLILLPSISAAMSQNAMVHFLNSSFNDTLNEMISKVLARDGFPI